MRFPLLLIALAPALVWRSASAQEQVPEIGLTALDKDGKSAGQCPLQRTEVHSDISGTIAYVSVKQRFKNTSTGPIEALYTFPLPHDAAVNGMKFAVGNRTIFGEIKRREEARAVYEQARRNGQSAALLDQERPNIFTQRVANLMPGSDVVVDISYVQPVGYKDGSYEWTFPTVVGPRYTPTGGYKEPGKRGEPASGTAVGTNAVVVDPEKITPPIVPPGLHAGHDITMDVELESPVPLGDVSSALHQVNIKREGDDSARINLKAGSELPNRDFVLRWKPKDNKVQAGLVTKAEGTGGYFSLVLQPPAAPEKALVSPKEMVFVIDQTGSQAGAPIAKAKETMRYCINNLNPGDTFQILGFNTQVFPCFPKPVEATEENIAKAQTFISPLEGNGGTDILKATETALQIPDDPARTRIVCFMTDGYVGNDAQILKYVAEHGDRAKMFPFGVGNSVNRNLIDGMAREGRGLPEYVYLNEDGQVAAKRFYNRVSKPLLVNIGIDWGDAPVADVLPGGIPDLYESGPIVLTGRYKHAGKSKITVHGMLGGKAWRQTVELDFPEKSEGGEGLPSLWARARIDEIQAQAWRPVSGEPAVNVPEQVTQVALEYKLMSQYTSFVAVEPKVVNIGGKQLLVDIPVEMPDGVGYGGIFGSAVNGTVAVTRRSAKTALSASDLAAMAGVAGFGGGAVAGGAGAAGTGAGGTVNGTPLLPSGDVRLQHWNPGPPTNAPAPAIMPNSIGTTYSLAPGLILDADGGVNVGGAAVPLTPEILQKHPQITKLSRALQSWLIGRSATPPAAAKTGDPEIYTGTAILQIWIADLKPEERKALDEALAKLGWKTASELKPNLLLGTVAPEALDKVLELKEVLYVEVPVRSHER